MSKAFGKEKFSSRKGGDKELPSYGTPKSSANLESSRNNRIKYDELDMSQTNESGFREGGIILFDPNDPTNFNKVRDSPITQGRQSHPEPFGKTPNEKKSSIFKNVRDELKLKDRGDDDDIGLMTINIAKKGGFRENSPVITQGKDGEGAEDYNTYVPRRITRRSTNKMAALDKEKQFGANGSKGSGFYEEMRGKKGVTGLDKDKFNVVSRAAGAGSGYYPSDETRGGTKKGSPNRGAPDSERFMSESDRRREHLNNLNQINDFVERQGSGGSGAGSAGSSVGGSPGYGTRGGFGSGPYASGGYASGSGPVASVSGAYGGAYAAGNAGSGSGGGYGSGRYEEGNAAEGRRTYAKGYPVEGYEQEAEIDPAMLRTKGAIKNSPSKGFQKGKGHGKLIAADSKILELKEKQNNNEFQEVQLDKANQRLSTFLLNKKGLRSPIASPREYAQSNATDGKQTGISPGKKKLSKIAFAMLASRGPNCEDRVITRVMRGEDGGVVDLGINECKSKKYEVKKFGRKAAKKEQVKVVFNPKQRTSSAKIIQAWWKDILSRYQILEKKVTQVQSVWRGFWYRKYLYDIIYYTYMTKAFTEKMHVFFKDKIRADVFETLKKQFAYKFWIKNNLGKIIALQRKIQQFLKIVKNKKKRCCLLLDKLPLRRLREAFESINNFSELQENKEKIRKKAYEAFLDKVHKAFLKRKLHELFFRTYIIPLNEMREMIFNKTLRANLIESQKTNLRKYFSRWVKRALAVNDGYKTLAVNVIIKNIIKPLYDEFIARMRRTPKKGLKERLLRRIIKEANNDKMLCLKNYLALWRRQTHSLAVKEFKDDVSEKFLFRTAQRKEYLEKLRFFKRWRNYVNRVKDITPFIEGLPLLKRHILRKAFVQGIPPLDNSINGIKGRCLKNMCSNFPKFRLIPLRWYFEKWKKIKSHLVKLETSALFLKSLRRNCDSKHLNRILSGRFNDWRRKAAMLNYLDAMNTDDIKEQKNRAVVDMKDALTKFLKRKAFEKSYPQIKNYLIDQIKSKAVKAMLKKFKFLDKICLRKYFGKYKKQVDQEEKQDVKRRILSSGLKNVGNGIKLKTLYTYFTRWIRNIPKNSLVDIQNGLNLLLNHARRNTIRNPYNAFKRKIDRENIEEGMKIALGFKGKFLKKKWRDYFYLWKKKQEQIEAKEVKQQLAAKLMNKFTVPFIKKIMLMKLRKWKSKKPARISLHQLFLRNKFITTAIETYASEKLDNFKRHFFDNLKAKRGNKAIMTAYQKLLDFALHGKKLKIKFWFTTWKDKCKELEIKDLRHQLMRLAFNKEISKAKCRNVAKWFYRWKNNKQLLELKDSKEKLVDIYKGLEKLRNIMLQRAHEKFNKLKRLNNLDTRGKIILMINKRLNKPRYDLRLAFEKMRRKAQEMKSEEDVKALQRKVCAAYTKKLTKRMERDNLMKKFRLWKFRTSRAHVLPDVMMGTDILHKALRRKFCGYPLSKLLKSKNYKNLFSRMLPVGSKLLKRWETNSKMRLWKLWLLQKDRAITRDLKAKIFERTGGKLSMKIRLARLTRWFKRWKQTTYVKPINLADINNAVDILTKRLRRPHLKQLLDKAPIVAAEKDKKKATNAFLKSNKGFMKLALRNKLRHWWKKSLLADDETKPLIMRNLKRMLVENYIMGPKEKYFRRWFRLSTQKPQDHDEIAKAIKHLKRFSLLKNIMPSDFFNTLSKKRSPFYLEKSLVRGLLPKFKKLSLKFLKIRLWKWKKASDYLSMLAIKTKFINNTYGKTQKALMKRHFLNYFRLWQNKQQKKKEIDLRNVIRFNNNLFGLLARKYLRDFIPEFKEFSIKKFLRNALLKRSKFHRRALEPFFLKWRDIADVLKSKEVKGDFCSKILQKTHKFLHNKRFTDIMRNRLRLWHNTTEKMIEREKEITPQFIKHIKRKNLQKNLPDFLNKLHRNSIETLRHNVSLGLLKKNGLLIKRSLRLYFLKWFKKHTQLKLRDAKLEIFSNHLTQGENKRKKSSLRRAFEKMKRDPKKENMKYFIPFAVATDTLKRLLNRRPWQHLKKKTGLMNLKIPHNYNMSQALINFNPNICKSMSLRNYIMRRFFKRWNSQAEHEKTKELEAAMFKKLFLPNLQRTGKLAMRRLFRLWADNTQKINLLETKKDMQLTLMKNMYLNNSRLNLKRHLLKWYNVLKDYMRRLNQIALGVDKLRSRLKRGPFRTFFHNVMFAGAFDKTPVAKKILMNWLKRTEKGSLFWAFNLWGKKVQELRQLKLKHKIFKSLINRFEMGERIKGRNRLMEAMLFWRIQSSRNKFDILKNIRLGHEKLAKGMRKPFNQELLDKLNEKAKKRKFVKAFSKLVKHHDDEAKNDLLKEKFDEWKDKTNGLGKVMDQKLKDLIDESVEGPLRPKRITKPISDLLEFAEKRETIRQDSANTINKFLRNGINEALKKLSKDKLEKIKYLMDNLCLKQGDVKKKFMLKWLYHANMIQLIDSIRKIQRYLRKKKDDVSEKRDNIEKLCEEATKKLRCNAFDKLKEYARKKRLQQLLLRNIKDIPQEVKVYFIKKYLKLWYAGLVADKNKTAGDLINSMCRRFFAVKLKNLLKAKKLKMNKIVLNLVGKNTDKAKIYLLLWRLNARQMTVKSASERISSYLRNKLDNLLAKKAKTNLRDMLYRFAWKQVKDALRQSSKVNNDRGNIFYETLKEIYLRRPFNKIKNTAILKTQIAKLGDVLPLIYRAMKMHYIPHYLRLWKKKASDTYLENLLRLQHMIKGKLILLRKKTEVKKKLLAGKILGRLANDENLKRALFLKLWHNKAKTLSVLKAQSTLSSIWKGNTSRKNVERQKKKIQLKKFLRRILFKKLNRSMIKAFDNQELIRNNLLQMKSKFEKRYAVNDLLHFSGNKVRNMMLYKLTKNINFNNHMSLLQKCFLRWKYFSNTKYINAVKVQTRYRMFVAKKKLELKRNVKDTLLKVINNYITSDANKVRVFFLRWGKSHELDHFNKNSNKIQAFLRRRVENLRRQKRKDFFDNLGKRIVGDNLKKVAKVDSFLKTLRAVHNPRVLDSLKYHLLLQKLRKFFLKRFADMDNSLRKLYLLKFLNDWKKKALSLSDKRNSAATFINKITKGFLERKRTLPILRRNKLLQGIEERLRCSISLKFQAKLLLWMKICKLMNTDEASRILQAYLKKIKLKSKFIKKGENNDNLTKGTEKLQKLYDENKKLEGFTKILRNAYHKKLSKDLDNDYLKRTRNAFDKTKQWAGHKIKCILFLQNRIRNFLYARKFGKLLAKLRKLREIMKLAQDRERRILHKNLRLWKAKAYQLQLSHSAEVIQHMLRRNVLRFRKNQKNIQSDKFRKFAVLNVFLRGNLKPYAKAYNNFVRFSDGYQLMFSHIFNKFAYRCLHHDKLKSCSLIYNIRNKLVKKFLKMRLNMWLHKAKMLRILRGVKMIQKNYRIFRSRNRNQTLNKDINNIIKNLNLKYSNKIGYFFNKWLNNHRRLKIASATNKISDFTLKYLTRLKAHRNWFNLVASKKKYERGYDLKDIILQLKKRNQLGKLFNKLKVGSWKKNFKDLYHRIRMIRLMKQVKLIFSNFEKRMDFLHKQHRLRLWQDKMKKLVRRDEALVKMTNSLHKRRCITDSHYLGDAMLLKRSSKLINTIRSKYAVHKIKQMRDHKLNVEKFLKLMIKGEKELLKKNEGLSAERIKGLYRYQILNNLYKRINHIDHKYYIPQFTKDFWNRLKSIYCGKTYESYLFQMRQRSNQRTCRILGCGFQAFSRDDTAKEQANETTSKNVRDHLLASILMSFYKKRITWGLLRLLFWRKTSMLASGLSNLCKKHDAPREAFNKIKAYYMYILQTPIVLQKFKNFLRLAALKQIFFRNNKLINKRLRLRYLLRVAFMDRGISELRELQYSLRKWHYKVKVKSIAKQKMMKLYQNMQLQFLSMANNMFGNEEGEMGVFDEMSSFNDKFDSFGGDFSVHKKKFCKGVAKKYIFENLHGEEGEVFYEEGEDGGKQNDSQNKDSEAKK